MLVTGLVTTLLFIKADGILMYFIATCCLFMMGIQIYHLLKGQELDLLVDKDEATEYYRQWIEKNRKITIPDGFTEHWSDETQTVYRFVFKWKNPDTGDYFYAPIEIFKYYVMNRDGKLIIQLGHGRGKVTTNTDEIQAFILRDQKASDHTHIVQVVNDIMANNIDQKLENEYGLKRSKEEA